MKNSEMKVVAHIINSYLPITQVWIYPQITYLKKYKPIVLTYCKENIEQFPFKNIYSVSDLNILIKYCNKIFRRLLGYSPYWMTRLKKEKCKIIHAHFGSTGYYSLGLKRKLKLPLITSFYGFDTSQLPRKKGWLNKLRILFTEGNLFLVEGNYMKERLIELGCMEEKIRIYKLGIEIEKIPFEVRTISNNNEVRILIAASFKEKKGILYGIKAFAKVKEKFNNAKLIIMGDGELKNEIILLIKKLNLINNVKLIGYQSHSVFIKELLNAHIFLSPSITARDGDTEGGAPVSIIEAQATGMPVVSTYHADIPEAVIENVSGYLVRERDVNGLAKKILFLIENYQLWGEIGKEARRYIEDNYSIRKQIQKLENIYDELV